MTVLWKTILEHKFFMIVFKKAIIKIDIDKTFIVKMQKLPHQFLKTIIEMHVLWQFKNHHGKGWAFYDNDFHDSFYERP